MSCQMLLTNGNKSEIGELSESSLFVPHVYSVGSTMEMELGWDEG